eukprot:9456437-Karenia_brevis.AAC.1
MSTGQLTDFVIGCIDKKLVVLFPVSCSVETPEWQRIFLDLHVGGGNDDRDDVDRDLQVVPNDTDNVDVDSSSENESVHLAFDDFLKSAVDDEDEAMVHVHAALARILADEVTRYIDSIAQQTNNK